MALRFSFIVFLALLAHVMGHGTNWAIPNGTSSLPLLDMGTHNVATFTFDKFNQSLGVLFSPYQVSSQSNWDSCTLGSDAILILAPSPSGTVVKVNRTAGTYYFIDGNMTLCKLGVKLIIIYGNGSHSEYGSNSTNMTGTGAMTGTAGTAGTTGVVNDTNITDSALTQGFSWVVLFSSLATFLVAF